MERGCVAQAVVGEGASLLTEAEELVQNTPVSPITAAGTGISMNGTEHTGAELGFRDVVSSK